MSPEAAEQGTCRSSQPLSVPGHTKVNDEDPFDAPQEDYSNHTLQESGEFGTCKMKTVCPRGLIEEGGLRLGVLDQRQNTAIFYFDPLKGHGKPPAGYTEDQLTLSPAPCQGATPLVQLWPGKDT